MYVKTRCTKVFHARFLYRSIILKHISVSAYNKRRLRIAIITFKEINLFCESPFYFHNISYCWVKKYEILNYSVFVRSFLLLIVSEIFSGLLD